MATIQDLGKVAYFNKGTYDSKTTYEINDVVSYKGSSYVSLTNDNKGNIPTDTNFWNVVAQSAYEIAVQNGYEGTQEEWTEQFLNADNYYNKNEINQKENKKLDNYNVSNIAELSDDLLNDSSLWVLNDGWIGNDSDGFSHIVGQSTNLEYNYIFDSNKLYMLSFDVFSPSGQGENASCAFTVQIGNSELPIMYRNGGSTHYDVGIKTNNSGILKFLCVSPTDQYTSSTIFNGTISNIELKEVTGNIEQLSIKDGDDNDSLSFTITKSVRDNICIGENSMKKSTNSDSNVYIGTNAGEESVASFYNVGIGHNSLRSNVQGSRNIAIGFNTLQNNISADRNIAIGGFCMNDNINGRKNIAMGFDTLQHLTTGQNNMAIGNQSLGYTTSSSNNIAIGSLAMGSATATGNPNIALGNGALNYLTTGNANIGIGYHALYKNTTGTQLIGIGNTCLNDAQEVSRTVAIGNNCLNKLTSGQWNISLGFNNSNLLTTMNKSILMATNTDNYTQMTNSILIGDKIHAQSTNQALEDVIVINNGAEQTNIASNHRTIISNAIYVDTSQSRKKVGIQVENPTARLHLSGVTANANTAPIKLNQGTLMTTPEDGAFEYANNHLYFTIGSTRTQIV